MSDEQVPKEYVSNFNKGYLMSMHLPQLGDQLAKAMEQSGKTHGFMDGHKQWEAERSLERTPDWLRSDWRRDIDKGNDRSLDKDERDWEPPL